MLRKELEKINLKPDPGILHFQIREIPTVLRETEAQQLLDLLNHTHHTLVVVIGI